MYKIQKSLSYSWFLCQILIMDLFNPLLIKNLEEILKKDPTSKSFCSLAQIYCSQSEFKKAEQLCLKGLTHNPSYSQGYVILGEVYKAQGDIEKAIKVLNKAKEFNPDNPNIYKNLAEIYKTKKDLEKTLDSYKMLSFLKPEDKTASAAIPHLETILGHQLVKENLREGGKAASGKTVPSPYKSLSLKQRERFLKLKKILARVENHISEGLETTCVNPDQNSSSSGKG